MKQKSCWIARAGVLAVIPFLVADGVASPTSSAIPLDPHGDALVGANGAPTALSPEAFLIAAEGADGSVGTADDVMLLVGRLGEEAPQVTALATPFLAPETGPPTRLSATRALVAGAGPDGLWNTTDDVVFDLDRLGSGNTVDAVTTGGLDAHAAYRPERVTADSFVVLATGADGVQGTADDALTLVTDLEGGSPVVHTLAAPYLPRSDRSRPVTLSPAAVLVASTGPDATAGTADDAVYMFRNLGSSNTRTDFAVPYLLPDASGRPARVSWTRALVATGGVDGLASSADDELVVLDELGAGDVVRTITVGALLPGGAGAPTALTYDRAVLASAGTDTVAGTADDALLLVHDLATGGTVDSLTVGGLGGGPACRPVKLSRRSCAMAAAGTDLAFGTIDDELVVVTGIGLDETLGRQVLPGLDPGIGCRPVRLSAESVLVSNGGADATLGTTDDVVSLVSGFAGIGRGGFPAVESFPAAGAFDGGALPSYLARTLGGGRAVLAGSGDDDMLGSGTDDVAQVLEGVPEGRGLSLRRFRLRYRARRPDKPARIRVQASMPFEDPEDLAETSLTISLGNASQTIPGSAFKVSKKGNVKYADKKGRNGFIRKLRWKAKNGNLLIVGKGAQTGVESTDPGYVPVAVEGDDFCVGHCVQGDAVGRGDGLEFKERKQKGAPAQQAPGGPGSDVEPPHDAGPGNDDPGPERDGPHDDDAQEPAWNGPAEDDPGPEQNQNQGDEPGPPDSAPGNDDPGPEAPGPDGDDGGNDDAPGPSQEGPANDDPGPTQEGPANDDPGSAEGDTGNADPGFSQEGPANDDPGSSQEGPGNETPGSGNGSGSQGSG